MSTAIAIRAAGPDDLQAFYGRALRTEMVLLEGCPVAMAMLALRPDGRVFAWLDVKGARGWGCQAVLAMRQALRTIEGPVYAGCFDRQYPTAPRLLRLLGFVPTDEIQDNGNRVWVRA